MRTQRRTKRPGFTLIEMLVSMALILFIMMIVAQVFGSASRVFTELRTIGDLQARLRTASTQLRQDLSAEKFAGPFIPGRSGPRVSDQRLDLPGWVPARAGYFVIGQGGPSIVEPILLPNVPSPDGEGLLSTRATNHFMMFTVNLPNAGPSELFCAEAPAVLANNQAVNVFPTGLNIVYSRWAEIAYFLTPSGDQTPGGLPLFSLRRRIRVLGAKTTDLGVLPDVTALALVASYPELALDAQPVAPGTRLVRLIGPEDCKGVRRLDNFSLPPQPVRKLLGAPPAIVVTGDDILLTDVLSFEIRANWQNNARFNQLIPGSSPPVRSMTLGNTEDPFDDIPVQVLNAAYPNQRMFDTYYRDGAATDVIQWDTPVLLPDNTGFLQPALGRPPLRINVRALQIKIRVWDPKAEQARQITIVQEV